MKQRQGVNQQTRTFCRQGNAQPSGKSQAGYLPFTLLSHTDPFLILLWVLLGFKELPWPLDSSKGQPMTSTNRDLKSRWWQKRLGSQLALRVCKLVVASIRVTVCVALPWESLHCFYVLTSAASPHSSSTSTHKNSTSSWGLSILAHFLVELLLNSP